MTTTTAQIRVLIAKPGLDHRPKIAGRVVVKLHHLHGVALVQDHHPFSDIVC